MQRRLQEQREVRERSGSQGGIAVSNPDMIVIEEKARAQSRQMQDSALTASHLLDNSQSKILGLDMSVVSNINLVGGPTMDPELN